MERDLTIRLNKLERKLDALMELMSRRKQSTLLPIAVAAARMGKSVNALRMAAKRGSIDCHYDGKHYYFDSAVVEARTK